MNIRQRKKENNLKLFESVKNNNLKEVSDLFDVNLQGDLKPEINNRDFNSLTPLHYSCLNGNYNITLILLKNEANIEMTNELKQTPLIIAAMKYIYNIYYLFFFKLLFKIIKLFRGHDSIVSLLLTSGCDINSQDYMDNTALHYACIYSYKEVILTLLARPSLNPYLKNKENKFPFELKIPAEIAFLFENFFKEKKRVQEENRKITIHKANQKNVEKMFEGASFEEKNTNPSVSFSKVLKI